MKSALTRLAAAVAPTTLLGPAFAQDQADLITPVTEPLTFVFIPKVIHPWYDVVPKAPSSQPTNWPRKGSPSR